MTYRRLEGYTDVTGVATVMPKRLYYDNLTWKATVLTSLGTGNESEITLPALPVIDS